jgi:hypothetical protein
MNHRIWGADADELDVLARQFGESARRVDATTKRLSALLRSAPWEGRAADHFRADWSRTHVPHLRHASTFLAEGERRLHDQARQQRGASSAGPSSAVGSVGGSASGWGALLGLGSATLTLMRDSGVTKSISVGWQFAEKAKHIVGMGNTYFDALQLAKKVPVSALQDLVPIATPIDVIFAVQDGYQSIDAFRHGDIDGGVRNAIDVGWAVASLHPVVGLLKGGFDIGWEVGLGVTRFPPMQSAMADSADEVVAYARRHGHGDEVGTRYDGVGGAFNMARDVTGAFTEGLLGGLR